MKRKRFSTEQIVAVMKQRELGTPAAEIIRKLGIAEQTFYRRSRRHAPPHLWRHPDGDWRRAGAGLHRRPGHHRDVDARRHEASAGAARLWLIRAAGLGLAGYFSFSWVFFLSAMNLLMSDMASSKRFTILLYSEYFLTRARW